MSIDREELGRKVEQALAGVKHPTTGVDVLTSDRVRELEVGRDGVVRMQFQLGPQDPGSLVKEVRQALEAIDGVAKVKIDVKLPQAEGAGSSAPRGGGGHGHAHGAPG